MAEGIVDALELIEIEKQQRQESAVSLSTADGFFQIGDEKVTVGDLGERIVSGEVG